MLEQLTNPDLINQILKNEHASEAELELAYRLRDAIDEIELLGDEVGTLQAQSDLWQGEN